MTNEEALTEAKRRYGPRAVVDRNDNYTLCCAIGTMSIPEPGDHSRFILLGLARNWDTAFLAADLNHQEDLKKAGLHSQPRTATGGGPVNRVVIVVKGGSVQCVAADSEVHVILKDWDNLEAGGELLVDFPVEVGEVDTVIAQE